MNKLSNAKEDNIPILGHLLWAASQIAKQFNLDNGFRVVINSGDDAGQTVDYIHVHLLGGAKFGWPPGTNF